MKPIVVTDTHTRMSLAAVRALGKAGYSVTAVTRASQSFAMGQASRYAAKRITLPDEGYTDALLSLGMGNKPLLLCAGAFTLQAAVARRNEFLQVFQAVLPDEAVLAWAGDKKIVKEQAQKLGLRTPTEFLETAPKFPCVIKYINGEALHLPAHARYTIVHQEKDYENCLSRMKALGDVFISEYVPGQAYGVSVLLNRDSDPVRVFCHQRVREYPLSGGPATCAVSVWHEPLVDAALALLKAMKLSGFAMVEFKGTPERACILEINPRIWGTYPLAELSGAGMAAAYAQLAENGSNEIPIDRACHYQTGLKMQYLPNDLMHWFACLRTGFRSEGSVPGDFFSRKVRGGVFDWKDVPGSWGYVRAVFKRKRKR